MCLCLCFLSYSRTDTALAFPAYPTSLRLVRFKHLPVLRLLSGLTLFFGISLSLAHAQPVSANIEDDQRLIFDKARALTQQREQAILPAADTAESFTLKPEVNGLSLEYNGQILRLGYSEQDLGRALFISINLQRWDDVRTLQKFYLGLPEHKPAMAAFVEAGLLQAEGRFAAAKERYRTALDLDPAFTRAQLDLAQLLFLDKEDRESQQFFSSLQATPLPAGLSQRISAYLNALDLRHAWNGYVSLGMVDNNNINQSNGNEIFQLMSNPGGDPPFLLIITRLPKPIRARGPAYEFSANKNWQLRSHHYLTFRSSAYGQHYSNYREYSDDHVSVHTGYAYQSARDTLAGLLVGELHRQDASTDYRVYGLRGEWGHNFLPRANLSLQAEHKLRRYTDQNIAQRMDGRQAYVGLQGYYSFTPNTLLFGGVDYTRFKTDNSPTDSYRQKGVRLGLYQQFGSSFSTTLMGMQRNRRFDGPFLSAEHYDKERIYIATLKADALALAGFTPVLSFKHTRLRSSIDWMLDYHQNEVSLKFEKQF